MNNFYKCNRGPKSDFDELEINKDSYVKRFWDKVEKTDDCWNWKAAKNNSGYGVFGAYKTGYKKSKFEYAHRLSFFLHNGPFDNNSVVDHKCRNRCCVNPGHLQLIAHEENAKQGAGVNRSEICAICGDQKYIANYASITRMVCKTCSYRRMQKYKAKPT